jgi:hypothetical protein
VWSGKETESARLKYWEIIADNLKTAGWSLGWVSALDLEGRTSWIADAHRDAKRFVVHADDKLTAFLELESAIRRLAHFERCRKLDDFRFEFGLSFAFRDE